MLNLGQKVICAYCHKDCKKNKCFKKGQYLFCCEKCFEKYKKKSLKKKVCEFC